MRRQRAVFSHLENGKATIQLGKALHVATQLGLQVVAQNSQMASEQRK